MKIVWEERDTSQTVLRQILPNLITMHIPHASSLIARNAAHVHTVWRDIDAVDCMFVTPSDGFELLRFNGPYLYSVVSKDKTSGIHGCAATKSKCDNIP
jgi:hypothetical protein